MRESRGTIGELVSVVTKCVWGTSPKTPNFQMSCKDAISLQKEMKFSSSSTSPRMKALQEWQLQNYKAAVLRAWLGSLVSWGTLWKMTSCPLLTDFQAALKKWNPEHSICNNQWLCVSLLHSLLLVISGSGGELTPTIPSAGCCCGLCKAVEPTRIQQKPSGSTN